MKPQILFLTICDRRGASGRYRVYQFEALLRAAGFGIRILPPAPKGSGLARIRDRRKEEARLLEEAGSADAVFIQKRLFSCGFIRALCDLGKPIVFDFDDAIFTSQRGGRSALTRARVTRRLQAVLRRSSLVLAGNSYLADYARPRARRVEILPTAVDVSRYPLRKHAETATVTLGWIGSRVTEMHLDELRDVLLRLTEVLPEIDVQLMVISDRDYDVPGLRVINKRWSEQSEVDDLLLADVGLMPLEDTAWTRGKCGLKALQYMAAGIPAVCSAVGANNEIVAHGDSGYLCASASEWLDALAKLARDPGHRQRLGESGRHRVEECYSTTRVGQRLVDLLRSLVDTTA